MSVAGIVEVAYEKYKHSQLVCNCSHAWSDDKMLCCKN